MRTTTTTTTPPPTTTSLGRAAARGFSWLLGQTLGTKAINTVANIVLAWLLAREDFGLIGLAYTVTTFISVLRQAGLREILIHRNTHFNRWANPVFWMSFFLGTAAMVLTCGAIPLAQRLYDAPQLGGILAILSVNALLAGLIPVPQAKLSNDLRFKAQAVIMVAAALAQAIIACLLAWAGWGAYAIAVAAVAGMVIITALYWVAAPVRLKFSPQMRRWRFLVGDSAAMGVTGLLLILISQGDYMALGIFHDTITTGLYYFAFNLSIQTVTIFTNNLGNVLFPTLAKLQDEPGRQTDAFLRASRLLAMVAVPACFVQAAIADPVFRLFFPARWHPAIPVMEILSLGMAWWAVGSPARSLMQSQGRFKGLLILSIICAAGYMTAVMLTAALGGMIAVAIAEAVTYSLMGPLYIHAGIQPGGLGRGAWKQVVTVYWPATLGSLASLVPGVLIAQALPAMTGRSLVQIGIILGLGGPLYLLILKRLAPADCRELIQRIGSLLKRRSAVQRVMDAPAHQDS
ncbi:MAG: oligosaccharide flippase family protein [Phycisphaerales bacterium]|nr:oligosaccharide flippase family protein [Phycisphaerales bacterium]